MTKKQIYISIAGITLIGILFSLPKVIVKNPDKNTELKQKKIISDETHEENENHTHELHLEKDEVNTVAKLVVEISQKGTSKVKKIVLADSVAKIFQSKYMYDSAAKYISFQLQLSPSAEIYEKEGDNYLDASNFATDIKKAGEYASKAQSSYKKVIANNATNLDVSAKLAMTYISSPNPMEGIMMLKKNLEMNPKHTPSILNLGLLAIQSGQYDKAAKRFEDLIKIEPANVRANLFLGISYKELGKKELAKEYLKKVKILDPDPEVNATVDGYLKDL